MYKILIAEDEQLIYESIQMSIDYSAGVELCGYASDGKIALEMIESRKPEIVLLDMNMPRLNGIALLRRLSELESRPEVIVISGYDEFTYTHPSLIYGVVDYIRKPVASDLLNGAIEKAISRIQKNRREKMRSAFWADSMQQKKDTIVGALFHRIIQDPSNHGVALARSLETQHNEEIESYVMLGIGPLTSEVQLLDGTLMERVLSSLNFQTILLSQIIADKRFAVIFSDTQFDGGAHRNEIIRQIGSAMQTVGCGDISMALSDIHCTISEGSRAFDEVEAILKASELAGEKSLHTLQDFQNSERIKRFLNRNHLELLQKALMGLNLGDCEEIVACGLLSSFAVKGEFEHRLDLVNGIVDLLERFAHSHNLMNEEIADRLNDVKFGAAQNTSFFLLNKSIMAAFASVMQVIKNSKYNKQLYYLLQTKEYVDQNFWDDISLEGAARIININASYLSVLFKEYFGVNFVDYVTQIRLNRAKKLLLETEQSVEDIAGAIGYPNTKYFLRLFKKRLGMTPTQYREAGMRKR